MSAKKVFAVVFGGASSEHEVSCVSAAWVVDNINNDRYDVIKIGITKNGVWFLYNGDTEKMRNNTWTEDKPNLVPCVISPCTVQHGIFVFNKGEGTFKSIYVDAVFPVLHGKNGEDGTIQGLLSVAGIPFVGADTYSSSVCMNKHAAKTLVKSADIARLADWIAINKNGAYLPKVKAWSAKKGYPLFVKPACAGSSVGVSKVRNEVQLISAIALAFEHDDTVLVEEAIVGKEIEVAVLSCPDGVTVSRCGEIDSGADFYDYEAKYKSNSSTHYIPARIPDDVANKVRIAAQSIFSELGCKGFARVDFFVCDDGSIVFNEINTIPGMTGISLYPLLMADAGIDGPFLMDKLFESAVGGTK